MQQKSEGMKLHPVATEEAAIGLREQPLVAVDMGFSGSSKSCGVALSVPGEEPKAKAHHFGSAADAVAGFLTDHRGGVVVLEAPLSAAFNAKRNPRSRGDFEEVDKPRWWSFGAGAQMALSALYFCRRLDELVPQNFSIHLIEGFVVGDESGAHAEVAHRLARAFRGNCRAAWHTVSTVGETVSISEWFCLPRGQACPVILQPMGVQL